MRSYLMFSLSAILVLKLASNLFAGDIEGTVNSTRLSFVVVYVDKVPGYFKGGHAVLDQRSKVFTPAVLPVVRGTTVEFRNSDDLRHNAFGVGADEFNLGDWTKGVTRQHTFYKLGDVTILCNVHPEMEAWVLVLQNPYFAQPDSQRKYRISNVPPGEYVLKAWYRGKAKTQNVKVPPTGSVSANF